MSPKPYPEDKRRTLVERGQEDFIRFFEDITDRKGTHFLHYTVPPAKRPGFRKGHVPLKFKVPALISDLKKEISNSKAIVWDMFKELWRWWVISHQGLNQILEGFDNGADFDESGVCVTLPNSELDIQCFRVLLAASRDYQIDQETIRDFYEYGYFLPSSEIESLVVQAVPRAEIERQQRLAALPDQVAALSEAVQSFGVQLSEIEAAGDDEVEEPSQQVERIAESLEEQLSELHSILIERIDGLQQSINSSRLQFTEDTESLRATISEIRSVHAQAIERMNQQTQEAIQGLAEEVSALAQEPPRSRASNELAEITEQPRVAYQAVEIRRHYVEMGKEKDQFRDENEYLSDFTYCLRRFGIVDSSTQDEVATALHIALKAFPVIELADTRLLDVWRLTCGDNLHITTIGVGMGWLGLQDWFPDLLSDECFGERLRRIDLEASVREMLDTGHMLWAIHLENYDRSFPESYLLRFVDWLGNIAGRNARVFLTRAIGTNRCNLGSDSYICTARLPRPHKPEPMEARTLRPSDVVVSGIEWETWCSPRTADEASESLDLLEQLRQTFSSAGADTPIQLLREILRYQLLAHDMIAPTKALDWALTLRLLPWIGDRTELLEVALKTTNDSRFELPRFQEGLANAREGNP